MPTTSPGADFEADVGDHVARQAADRQHQVSRFVGLPDEHVGQVASDHHRHELVAARRRDVSGTPLRRRATPVTRSAIRKIFRQPVRDVQHGDAVVRVAG